MIPSSVGEVWLEGALSLRLWAVDQRKQEPPSLFCLTTCDFFITSRACRALDLTGDRGVTAGSSGSIEFFLFPRSRRNTAHTSGSVFGDERGPADPTDNFENWSRVGGKTQSHRRGLLLCSPLENVDKVANLVDSSLIGTRVECPLLLRRRTESSANKHLRGSGVGLYALQNDRRRMDGRKRVGTHPLKRATRRGDSLGAVWAACG